MGNKDSIADQLIPYIFSNRKLNQPYVEPFVGSCGMMRHIKGCPKRIGNDLNSDLIAMFIALQNGWMPPSDVSKEEYDHIKKNKESYPKELVAFVGFGCSFGGKWFNGYAKNNANHNYADTSRRSLINMMPFVKDVEFISMQYYEIEYPKNSIIYCDPPYSNTTAYKDKFDSVAFWEWCRDMERDGHKVFVSEYSAPEDFKCIKSIEVKTVMNKNNPSVRIENLFTMNKPKTLF